MQPGTSKGVGVCKYDDVHHPEGAVQIRREDPGDVRVRALDELSTTVIALVELCPLLAVFS
jgi:hypothetical protein